MVASVRPHGSWWIMGVRPALLGEKTEPFRQLWSLGGRVPADSADKSGLCDWQAPREEQSEVEGVMRARCRQVVEWMSLLSPLHSSWQPSLHVPASSLPPELRCHEAGEALQLRPVQPRTGCFLCPAQLRASRPLGLTLLPRWADREDRQTGTCAESLKCQALGSPTFHNFFLP